jgi:hypothetical protein
MALQAMVCDALSAGTVQADAAGAADRGAAAFVFVVGRDVADAGVQPDGVVLDADERELGAQNCRVIDCVEVWPVGVEVRAALGEVVYDDPALGELAKRAGFTLQEATVLLTSDAQTHQQLRELAARKLPEVDGEIDQLPDALAAAIASRDRSARQGAQ